MSQIPNALQRVPGLEFLQRLPRLAQMGIAAALVALFVVILMWSRSPSYSVLFSQIDDRDGGAIIAALEQMNVPYQLGDHGSAIYVPSDQVHQTRMNLAAEGLPKGGNVGFELMDESRFGASQFAEQVNYQRALEGELSQTIESLYSIKKARVHLALPRETLFTRDRKPASASVMLNLYPGRHLNREQVAAITWLVASSVPNLNAERVSVVDQSGQLLSQYDDDSGQLDHQRRITREVEELAVQRIINILAPVVGEDNIRAQVSAEIDFSQREETAETYTPNQKPGTAAIRSEQLQTQIDNQPLRAQGVPGALSNQPPAPAVAPIIDPPADTEESEQAENATGSLLSALAQSQRLTPDANARSEVIRNYEVDRHISHVKGAQNQLKRLSIAVVVNERQVGDQWQPFDQAELNNIRDLVSQAVGYRATRGDTLSVVNTRFTAVSNEDQERFWQRHDLVALGISLMKYVLLALLGFALWRIIVHPIIQSGMQAWAQAQAMREEQESQRAHERDIQARAAEINRYENNLTTARSMAEKDPRAVAMVLRAWMSKESKDDNQRR